MNWFIRLVLYPLALLGWLLTFKRAGVPKGARLPTEEEAMKAPVEEWRNP